MKELENIRDHVNYLRRFIPRSEWTRDDQRIVRLSAKIEAVLELHRPEQWSEPGDIGGGYMCEACFDPDAEVFVEWPCLTVRAIEGAGK